MADIKNEKVIGNIPKSNILVSERRRVEKTGKISFLHCHDEMEILVIYEGDFVAVIEDRQYVAHPGEIIFINSGVPHWTYSDSESHTTCLIQFKENDFISSEITRIIKYSARFVNMSNEGACIIRSADFFSFADEIIKEYTNKNTAYEVYIKSGIYKMLGYLYRSKILRDPEEMYNTKEVQKILPVLSYINKNYEENITLEETSAMLGFDPSYFCRIFKTATGATFTEYLNFVRICRAEKLLSRTEKSILDISEAVGFSSVSYFNRIFKKFKNCSPRQYRCAKYVNI